MANVRMSRRAIKDARTARLWYAQRDARAALGFDVALDAAARLIGEFPLACPIIDRRGVRRAVLRTYPYAVLDRVRGEDVTIVAVRHHRLAPES